METEYKKVKAIMSQTGRGEDAPEEPVTEVPDGVTQARQHLVKAANLMNLCVKCVDKVIAPNVPPIVQTSDFFQSVTMALFIEASRMRFIDRMPPRPLPQTHREPPPLHTKD
jgi:hypothetical protein